METQELIKLLQETKSDNVVIDIVVDGDGIELGKRLGEHVPQQIVIFKL